MTAVTLSTDSNESVGTGMNSTRELSHGTLTVESMDASPKFKKRMKRFTRRDIVNEFSRNTRCHGLPRIISAKTLPSRFVWSLVFFAALGAFVFQATKLIKLYLNYDVTVTIEDETIASLMFPAITICNTNKLRFSEIEKSEHAVLLRTDPNHPNSLHRSLSYQGPCLKGDFECSDGIHCIKPHLHCDGYIHCWDGLSDEVNCTYPPCGRDQFKCNGPGYYGICIDSDKRCDGLPHCLSGEDEAYCNECKSGFKCDDNDDGQGGKCVQEEQRCDRFEDCKDGQDESKCDSVYADPCDKNLSATSMQENLYSPLYPKAYPVEKICTVTIIAPPNKSILITFLVFDIEHNSFCDYDYLKIQDNMNSDLNVKLCGGLRPPPWISSSNVVTVTFRSDTEYTARGFHLVYEAVNSTQYTMRWEVGPWSNCSKRCGGGVQTRAVMCNGASQTGEVTNLDECKAIGSRPVSTKVCKQEVCESTCQSRLTHCCQVIQSKGYPDQYTNGQNCYTNIINEGGCINITFSDFPLEQGGSCGDFVELSDHNKPTLYRRICDMETGDSNPTWGSFSGNVSVTYRSNGEQRARGFSAVYHFLPCGLWHVSAWSKCNVTYGVGRRYRRVECRSRATNEFIENSFCEGLKPATEAKCTMPTTLRASPIKDIVNIHSLQERYQELTQDTRLFDEFRVNYYQGNHFYQSDLANNDTPDWKRYLTYSSSTDYSDLRDVLTLNMSDVFKYGHQFEDFVLQCAFNENKCDQSDFSTFQNDRYGNCFTFNNVRNDALTRRADKMGSQYGLKLTLYIEQDEYIPLYGQEAGVRILVHPSDITPFPEDDGITVAPGRKASIALREELHSSVAHPYSNCENNPQIDSIFGSQYNYSVQACRKTYLHQKIQQKCNCRDTLWLSKDRPACKITNTAQEVCRRLINFLDRRGVFENNCKEPCRKTTFKKTVSQSMWPSNKHLGGLLKVLRPINTKIRDKVVDEKSARDNLVLIEVFFEVPNYRSILNTPAYTVDQLFADIGGLMGLYVGISLITVVEFIELVYNLYNYFSLNREEKLAKRAKKMESKNMNHKYDPIPCNLPQSMIGTSV
ncbi:uncharacterized protein LOC102803109 [Saccoglossus kowalevskii]|uniref:Uncharacterized protein LOC102803109 n=1 Tax=Saccoglossus kowalevskii TaxID=10224 RepID=A0ABM0M8D5_SACKO|nr:PREDICTED: uncharacterized protein LOC102803109 [Saccoglossus kowalevskii]